MPDVVSFHLAWQRYVLLKLSHLPRHLRVDFNPARLRSSAWLRWRNPGGITVSVSALRILVLSHRIREQLFYSHYYVTEHCLLNSIPVHSVTTGYFHGSRISANALEWWRSFFLAHFDAFYLSIRPPRWAEPSTLWKEDRCSRLVVKNSMPSESAFRSSPPLCVGLG